MGFKAMCAIFSIVFFFAALYEALRIKNSDMSILAAMCLALAAAIIWHINGALK